MQPLLSGNCHRKDNSRLEVRWGSYDHSGNETIRDPCTHSLTEGRYEVDMKGTGANQPRTVVAACSLGMEMCLDHGNVASLFYSIPMGPGKLPPAALVGRAGGGVYCEVCRFHSVGICHLANSQVSAIPVRVSCGLHGQST